MNKLEFNVIHELCGDSWNNTASYASKISPHFGEPYFIKDYYRTDDGKYYDIMLIGREDNSADIESLLTKEKFFVGGWGAGYQLPIASSYTLGGITNPSKGLKSGGSGDLWVNTESLRGTNLKYTPLDSETYPGFGTLNVDLENYTGNVTIHGTLTANKLLSTPVVTGNVLKLREPIPDENTGETVLPDDLSSSDICGLEMQYISKPDKHAYFGVNNKSELIFKNYFNNYHIPIAVSSTLKSMQLIGLNENGIITEASLQPITIRQRPNSGSEWSTTTLNVTDIAAPSLDLTIPKRLSDLEDYTGEDKTTASYVSATDRKLWQHIITDVGMSASITSPEFTTDSITYSGVKYETKKLIVPQIQIKIGGGLTKEGDTINLPKISIEDKTITWSDLTELTYISDITCDEYGRVKSITRYKVNFS